MYLTLRMCVGTVLLTVHTTLLFLICICKLVLRLKLMRLDVLVRYRIFNTHRTKNLMTHFIKEVKRDVTYFFECNE